MFIRRCDTNDYDDGLVHERRNSIANALVLRLSCINLSMYNIYAWVQCQSL